ncbi:acetate/propionate family kinase [Nocardioides lijunqiniae]|uniref:acetate/propionate family kinase n=1 Tax=Nocardioides lijunqiniae TaxID=2760832 RepID=UPI00187870D8|nr:acetate/propionate family kinase [Nocardioides lijunqiniae]
MRVLVVNAGSSSLKLTLMDDDDRIVATTTVERWEGEDDLEPVSRFVEEVDDVEAVGHRIVHGGPRLTESVPLEDDVLAYLDSIEDLAPLHNPRAVAGIRVVRQLLPNIPEVACFDTTFHTDLPAAARTYALPQAWNERWSLRRYGFHGLSHAHAVRRAAELVGSDLADLRVVSCHLGAGASLAAVREGRCVDTTMGFTPVEGLVMATRSGSVDPGLLLWLLQHGDQSPAGLADVLEHHAGLKGLSGTSGDLRDVQAARDSGDVDAKLAFEVFIHRLRREIGAMAASAGGLDLLVFTGGIGEHEPEVRSLGAQGAEHLGASIDERVNAVTTSDRDISSPDARARTVVVTASEASEIARETRRVLGSPSTHSGPPARD